MHINQ